MPPLRLPANGLPAREPRPPQGWLKLAGVRRNNLAGLDVRFPLGVFTAVTGVSGAGKSSLVSQALVELVAGQLGHALPEEEEADELATTTSGHVVGGLGGIKRLVRVDQKPIGRTPRSNLATYTGLFDHVRKLFAATPEARRRKYDAGRFSFNVKGGRCEACEGEGFVSVELLFLPGVFAPCKACHGARYNPETLEVTLRGKTVAEVLGLTVEAACDFFVDEPPVLRALTVLRDARRLDEDPTQVASFAERQRLVGKPQWDELERRYS